MCGVRSVPQENLPGQTHGAGGTGQEGTGRCTDDIVCTCLYLLHTKDK